MYIPKALQKENSFVDVKLPANKMYFTRIGNFTPPADCFSGDEPVIMNQSKIQQIEDYKKFAEAEIEKESKSD